jgi:hypothetical protein
LSCAGQENRPSFTRVGAPPPPRGGSPCFENEYFGRTMKTNFPAFARRVPASGRESAWSNQLSIEADSQESASSRSHRQPPTPHPYFQQFGTRRGSGSHVSLDANRQGDEPFRSS